MTRRQTLLTVAILLLLLAFVQWRFHGPAPLPSNADPARFSASRARSVLDELLRENTPHPVGTDANRVIRERIERRFQSLGYRTEVQRGFVCNATPLCATVENILAVLPGDTGPFVVLSAHYDSVGAGPGASDDGVGVAALLEVARAIGGRRGLAFLITDGEEAGLLGAELFVTTPWKDRVTTIVNVENRGTSGPAFLFETSSGNAGLMHAMRALPRPATSSLFYTIYQMLPNDTDVTVFKRAGLQSLNFAAIGNVEYYHTPLDDLERVDMRTFQHHGDNLLAAARALGTADERVTRDAVFFDVLNLAIVWWPQSWTIWMALVSLGVLLFSARKESWRTILFGAGLALGCAAAAALLGIALVWLAHLRAGGAGRLAFPQPVLASMWLVGVSAAFGVFALARRGEPRALHAGTGILWHIVAVALAVTLPGTAYFFLVPAVAFSIGHGLRMPPLGAAILTSCAAAVLVFPLALFLYPALGRISLVPVAVLIALVAATLAPLVRQRSLRTAGAMLGAAALAAAITMALPVYTATHPRRAPIDHELGASTVDVEVSRQGDVATLRAGSARAADRLVFSFDGPAEVLRVNGTAPAPPARRSVWRGPLTVYGRDAVVEVRAAPGTRVTVTDLTYGLPPEEAGRAKARDAANAVTSHRGDVTSSKVTTSL